MVEAVPDTSVVPATEEAKVQKQAVAHPQMSGIDPVEGGSAKTVIDKVIDKIVRITVSDGRIYLGRLMAVDQTKTVFI